MGQGQSWLAVEVTVTVWAGRQGHAKKLTPDIFKAGGNDLGLKYSKKRKVGS